MKSEQREFLRKRLRAGVKAQPDFGGDAAGSG